MVKLNDPGVTYRYELKYVISEEIAKVLKSRIATVMDRDSHSVSKDYSYQIRSIYLDDRMDSSYFEKMDGVEFRAKYRMRMYNFDPSVIKLECKHKDDTMTYKEDVRITKDVAECILAGEFDRIETDNDFLLRFLTEAKMKCMKPSIIVDYVRDAYTYPTSEVRVTFDEHLRSGRYSADFFDPDIETFPIYAPGQVVLEVKCNDYIPEHILAIIQSVPLQRQSVSKFANCKGIF